MEMQRSQAKLCKIVFGIYLFLLTWLVLFKFGLDFSALTHDRFVNFIPFKESLFPDGRFNFREVIYNMLVFIPLGVYVEILWNKRSFASKILPAFVLSLAYEVIQFTFAIGISDVTDIIGNTLGGIVGALLFSLIHKLFKGRTVAVINSIGIAIEAAWFVIFAILFVANF